MFFSHASSIICSNEDNTGSYTAVWMHEYTSLKGKSRIKDVVAVYQPKIFTILEMCSRREYESSSFHSTPAYLVPAIGCEGG